jgi:hypothetical protein
MSASQRPHIFLDPGTNQGGELVVPFFSPLNGIVSYLTGGVNNQAKRMGSIWLASLNDLQSHNGSATDVAIRYWIWMEDIKLSGPTDYNFSTIVPQSGTVDEYGSGAISKPAHAISKLAGALEKAPVIGGYALATRMVADNVAKVASAFGYSRPTIIKDLDLYNPRFVGTLAVTDTGDTCQKFSLDSKQEVTIDPRVTGLSAVDEMSISHLAGIESLLTQFTWLPSFDPLDILWSCLVHPTLCNRATSAISDDDELGLTPMAWLAIAFRYWRGKIKFRFQVVGSAFQRGKMRIVYDAVQSTPIPEFNTVRSTVIDLASQRDCEIIVPWNSHYPWLEVKEPNDDFVRDGGLAFGNGDQINGGITVLVNNRLISPDTPYPVRVNVYVSGVDMEFGAPYNRRLESFSYFPVNPPLGLLKAEEESTEKKDLVYKEVIEPQSGMEPLPDADVGQNNPDGGDVLFDGVDNANMMQDLIGMGESVTSLRQLFKRYCFVWVDGFHWTGLDSGLEYAFKCDRHAFPPYRGAAPNVVPSGAPVNLTKNTHLNWFTPAFAARRGGVRFKMVPSRAPCECNRSVWVTRNCDNCNYANLVSDGFNLNNTTAYVQAVQGNDMPMGWDGMAITPAEQNPVLEFEVPYYMGKRWVSARNSNFTGASAQGLSYQFGANYIPTAGGVVSPLWYVFAAASEDYSLSFFMGVPRCYMPGETNPQPPVPP